MILAEKIARLRKSQGWSQEELAAQLDVSRQSVSKWESMASMPDLDKILKMSKLFDVSTDYLLKDDAEEEVGCASPINEMPLAAPRPISLEEANTYLELGQICYRRIALAITLFILSPIALLLVAGASESGMIPFSEDFAAASGTILLVCIIALGVAILLPSAMKMEEYEYLEKEPISTEYGVAGIVETKKEAFAPVYRSGLVIGISLCILSVIPLFVCMVLEHDFASICAVCLMLALIAAGVYGIVRVACVWESYQKLLEEGDYTR